MKIKRAFLTAFQEAKEQVFPLDATLEKLQQDKEDLINKRTASNREIQEKVCLHWTGWVIGLHAGFGAWVEALITSWLLGNSSC